MFLIEWSSDYSVNVREIDEQHKKLIGILNSLHDAMKSGRGNQVISGILSELLDYTEYHFSTEEDLFRKFGYPDLDHHKEEHAQLTAKAVELKSDFDEGRLMNVLEIIIFLKDWLNTHIMLTDKKYSAFLNGKGVK